LLRRALPILTIGLAWPAAASAQEAFTFSWVVQDVAGSGPANGNGIIEPGEDAMVYLHASFRPGVGGTAIWDTHGGTGQTGTVAGLGQVYFSLIGTRNLDSGSWGWQDLSPVPGFALSPGGIIEPGTYNLINMIFGQYIPIGATPNPRNDDWFFRARWHPDDYTPRDVTFRFQNEFSEGWPTVILDAGFRDPFGNIEYRGDRWTFNEPAGGFVVVPGPASWAVVLVAGGLISRRRRTFIRTLRT